jgi:hypothetical protein
MQVHTSISHESNSWHKLPVYSHLWGYETANATLYRNYTLEKTSIELGYEENQNKSFGGLPLCHNKNKLPEDMQQVFPFLLPMKAW